MCQRRREGGRHASINDCPGGGGTEPAAIPPRTTPYRSYGVCQDVPVRHQVAAVQEEEARELRALRRAGRRRLAASEAAPRQQRGERGQGWHGGWLLQRGKRRRVWDGGRSWRFLDHHSTHAVRCAAPHGPPAGRAPPTPKQLPPHRLSLHLSSGSLDCVCMSVSPAACARRSETRLGERLPTRGAGNGARDPKYKCGKERRVHEGRYWRTSRRSRHGGRLVARAGPGRRRRLARASTARPPPFLLLLLLSPAPPSLTPRGSPLPPAACASRT